jgi:hypothetical protein
MTWHPLVLIVKRAENHTLQVVSTFTSRLSTSTSINVTSTMVSLIYCVSFDKPMSSTTSNKKSWHREISSSIVIASTTYKSQTCRTTKTTQKWWSEVVQHLLIYANSQLWKHEEMLKWKHEKYNGGAQILNMILCNIMVVSQSWSWFCQSHSIELTIVTLVSPTCMRMACAWAQSLSLKLWAWNLKFNVILIHLYGWICP